MTDELILSKPGRRPTHHCLVPPGQTHSWGPDEMAGLELRARCLKCGQPRRRWPAKRSYDLSRGHRAETGDGLRCFVCGRAVYHQGRARTGWHHRSNQDGPIERFWKRVALADGDGCDLWRGGSNSSRGLPREGYGVFHPTGKRGGKTVYAHRFAWEEAHGPIPDGLFVLHHCDTPKCVRTRPDRQFPNGHLFLGTQAENVADMWAKGRNAQNWPIPR